MKKYIYFIPILISLTTFLLIFKSKNNSISKTLAKSEISIDFRNNFLEGCNKNKKNIPNNNFCTCLVEKYLDRYSDYEISQISKYSNEIGEKGTKLINLMMSPETRYCVKN